MYENWLRGEFGKPDEPKAIEFGRRLLADQAWTRGDLVSGRDGNDQAEAAKRADYQKIYDELGATQGYFTGTEGAVRRRLPGLGGRLFRARRGPGPLQ